MATFVICLDGKPLNVSLAQTVCINPQDTINVIWYFKNGEKYEEDLVINFNHLCNSLI
jgi:hypothetical protein